MNGRGENIGREVVIFEFGNNTVAVSFERCRAVFKRLGVGKNVALDQSKVVIFHYCPFFVDICGFLYTARSVNKNALSVAEKGICLGGTPSETRTLDPLIKSQLLYQLS